MARVSKSIADYPMSLALRSIIIGVLLFSGSLVETGAWSAETGPAIQWEDLLAGMMLKRESSHSSGDGGGFRATSVWHLCRGGSFRYSHSSTVSVEAPGSLGSSTSQVSQTGRWSVVIKGSEALLVLKHSNGTQTSHLIAYDGEQTYLDGERVIRAPSHECP